jgi:hypothetical protein
MMMFKSRSNNDTSRSNDNKYWQRLQPLAEQLQERFTDKWQQTYIEARWRAPLANAWQRKSRNMMRTLIAQWVALGGSASLPALVTASTQSSGGIHNALSVVTIISSVIVALATTFLQVTRVSQRWHRNRLLRDKLLREAWMVLTNSGEYSNEPDKQFRQFVERVETSIEEYNGDYYSDIIAQEERHTWQSSSDATTA